VDENFMKSWVQSLVSSYARPCGAVKFYALDNEPELGRKPIVMFTFAQTYMNCYPNLAYGAAINPPIQVLSCWVSFLWWTGYCIRNWTR